MYDVIVVGARCAGSALAMLLARRGHRVLAVDRAAFPSDTLSTHYIQQRGLARLRDWGLLDELVASGCPPIREMTVSYKESVITGFADPIEGIDATYAPRRTVFDKILVDAARDAGAEVRENCSVTELLFEGDRVVGIRAKQAGGVVVEERAPIVVGADGKGSLVAAQTRAPFQHVVPAECFVYYTYWSGLDTQFHSRIGDLEQVGFWPTHDGLTLTAVMQPRERYEEFRTDVEGNFRAVFKRIVPEVAEQMDTDGKPEEKFYGLRYPDNFYRQSAGAGWALVGDAGYHKDPLTGLGITDAFVQVEKLAAKIDAGLGGARRLDEAVAEYERERLVQTKGSYDFTCLLSKLRLEPDLEAVFRALSVKPDQARRFFGLLGGGITAEEFLAPQSLAAILGPAA